MKLAAAPPVRSAGPSARPLRGTSPLFSACVAASFLTFCVLVQDFSGAWSASFVAYPDEASHFVGAVMFREWLFSGQWFAPLEFAKSFYAHYPFFAVGYWPPLFSIVTGSWMRVAGVGRLQALLIPAFFAAGTGWLIFQFVRLRAGLVPGICAGALYLSLPVVRRWMCAVMVDHMTAFLCLAAAACLLGYLKRPVVWNGSLYAVISACAILSKYSGAYVVVLPCLAVLLLRRFELFSKASFLVQPLIIGTMVGPWALWTRTLAFYGLRSEPEALTAERAVSIVLETFKIYPPVLMAVVVLGLIALLVRPRAWREDGASCFAAFFSRGCGAAVPARAGCRVIGGLLRRLVGGAGVVVTRRTLGRCHSRICGHFDYSICDFAIQSLCAGTSRSNRKRRRIYSEKSRAGRPAHRRSSGSRRAGHS
jgi:hypothetical protein